MTATFSLNAFRPCNAFDLQRIGRDGDGGYIVSERALQLAQVVVGLGVNADWSFEAVALERYPSTTVVAVDGSVSVGRFRRRALSRTVDAMRLGAVGRWPEARGLLRRADELAGVASRFATFCAHSRVHFHPVMVGESRADGVSTWSDLLASCDSLAGPTSRIFVKMDIEGAEYRVLPHLLQSVDRLTGLVVEFHDCDLHWERLMEMLDAMAPNFAIVHVHGNNCAPLIEGTAIPRVLEVTFSHRSCLTDDEARSPAPHSFPRAALDMPNDQTRPDYALQF